MLVHLLEFKKKTTQNTQMKSHNSITNSKHTCRDSVVWDVGWPTFPYPCP